MTRLAPNSSSDDEAGPAGGPAAPVRFPLSRRRFLGLAGSSLVVAGTTTWAGRVLTPEPAAVADTTPPDLYLAGTDGWIYLPPTPKIGAFHPDKLAPAPFTTYVFGFRNVTGMSPAQRLDQKQKAQHSAPLFWVDEYDETNPDNKEFRVQLTNLGLAVRPDLFDAHTLHWHGFRNVIPFYDGEPSGSVSVPAGREFTYVYRPRDAGTYMWHCHVEDVEHVHMGMTGLVFVRPKQNRTAPGLYASGKYLYNDGDGSTGYDREFAMFLSEVWAEAHWADAHIQLPEWSDYRADFALLNGRVYPDTIAPNGPSVNAFHHTQDVTYDANGDPIPPSFDATGDLIPPDGRPELKYQPHSSLVTCKTGERVALRFANLGFRESAMTITGIRMRVVGRDATLMRGRNGVDTSYETDTINIGPGESYDVLFTAPQHSGGTDPDVYYLYNRSFVRSNNLGRVKTNDPMEVAGGQATQIHVYPADTPESTLGPQAFPNDWGI